MNGELLDGLGVFAATCAGCLGVTYLTRRAPESFRGFLALRVAGLLGRAFVVVGVMAALLATRRVDPLAATIGALGGWMVAAGLDAWVHQRRTRDGTRSR